MHRNKRNGKVYIGITRQNPPEKRWAKGRGYHHNEYFRAAIEKDGWEEGFEHIILEDHLSQEEACKKEKELIKAYDATNPEKGYNLADGGVHLGPTSFEKLTEWHNTHKKFGKDNVSSKRVRCIETNDVFGSISEACRWCDSTKVGECCRGHRKHAGTHPKTGIQLSWEYVDDDTEVTIICNEHQDNEYRWKPTDKYKKVMCIETEEVFRTEAEACKKYGAARGTIGRACSGKRKSALGKHWKWVE